MSCVGRESRFHGIACVPPIRHCDDVAESWFLRIDGIEGESKDVSHKDEIDVLSWSWGITNLDSVVGSGGGGAGKAAFQDFHFVSRISKASPMLFLACASGTHHKTAALSGVRTAGKSKSAEFLTYKLSDVVVTSDQHSGSDDDVAIEQFSLNYGEIEVSYTQQLASGKFAKPVRAGFDVTMGKGF